MPRGKGHPRCEKCEGRGIIRAPRGYVPCDCTRHKPNRKIIEELAAIELQDFEAYDDEWRRQRGLQPFHDGGQHDE